MSTRDDSSKEGGSALAVIAVPQNWVDDLVDAGLVWKLPTLRGPVFDAVVTIGMDSAALVTLTQAPEAIRAFATSLLGRVRLTKDTITITGNRDGRSIHLEVAGDVPVQAVTDFLLTALSDTEVQPSTKPT